MQFETKRLDIVYSKKETIDLFISRLRSRLGDISFWQSG